MGGWSRVKSLRQSSVKAKGDARILGSSEFVRQVMAEADHNVRPQLAGADALDRAANIIERLCRKHDVSLSVLRSGSRRQAVSRLRRQLALQLVNEIGLSLAETGRQIGLTTSGVAQIIRRNAYKSL